MLGKGFPSENLTVHRVVLPNQMAVKEKLWSCQVAISIAFPQEFSHSVISPMDVPTPFAVSHFKKSWLRGFPGSSKGAKFQPFDQTSRSRRAELLQSWKIQVGSQQAPAIPRPCQDLNQSRQAPGAIGCFLIQ